MPEARQILAPGVSPGFVLPSSRALKGRQNNSSTAAVCDVLPPLWGFCFFHVFLPTAHAVGYDLPLLRI